MGQVCRRTPDYWDNGRGTATAEMPLPGGRDELEDL
jgi:hypothetical protein